MAQPFEIDNQIEVSATPEQVWDAITTGAGMDGWFMGTSEVERREGGTVRTTHPAFTMESTVTTWDPPHRFAHRSEQADPDGRLHAFEYTVEPRGTGSTIRWHHSGFLGGDWEAEYEAMSEGDPMYFHKLAEYIDHFLGRRATVVDAFGPNVPDRDRVWPVIREGLGLPGPVSLGDRVRLTPADFPPIEGEVDYLSPSFLGVRTADALYRFIHGFEDTTMVGHHLFDADLDPKEAEAAWSSWLTELFTQP